MVVDNETKQELPDMRSSLVHQAWRWLAGQEFNNVLLAMILGSLAALAWYGAPAMLRQIQDGYERINTRHASDLQQARLVFERDSDRQYTVIQSLLRDRGIDIPNPKQHQPITRPE